MVGQSLSHYKILDRLGSGGMGVVYRAKDTRLDRMAAIKVLREEAVADPVRRKRFIQEAKAASGLNHPNIITIYDIDTADGVLFMAMELVTGRTLEQLIARKGLPWSEALKYAVQVADALAAAHEAGIIHRDIKPANIMVTEKRAVKVLDFGLAKLSEPGEAGEDAPTQSMNPDEGPRTEEGTILGTIAYMSPEQAEGLKVDARSDIFSFGAVLYEVVSGRRAFQGETKVSTLTAILHKQPTPLGELVPEVPPELEKIIARCLRKDPAVRYQHMGDLKIALDDLKQESDSGMLAKPPEVRGPVAAPGRRWVSAVLAAVAVVAAAGGLLWWRRSAPVIPAATPVLTRLTSDSGLTTDPVLSPDGKLLAYASDRAGEGSLDIWVQQIAGGGAVRLTRGEEDEDQPSFSPDGGRIAFHSLRGGSGIYVIPALGGGEPRLVAEQGWHPRFSPDGTQIAYSVGARTSSVSLPGASRLFVIPASGGIPKQLEPAFTSAGVPIWFPDGKHLLFLGRRDASVAEEKTYDWWVASMDGSPATKTGAYDRFRSAGLETTQIVPGDFIGDNVIFAAPSGDSTNLWRIPLSTSTWQAAEPPLRLTFGSGLEVMPSFAQGKVVFASTVQKQNLWSVAIDANQGKVTGKMVRVTQGAANDIRPALSIDGNKIGYLSGRQGTYNIWIRDFQTGKTNAITQTDSAIDSLALSPDGSKAAYALREDQKPVCYVSLTSGGASRKIPAECTAVTDWSADGRKLFYVFGQPMKAGVWDEISGEKSVVLSHPRYAMNRFNLSPDNRWAVFRGAMGSNRSRTFVTPVRLGGPIPESDWIPIHEGTGSDRPAAAWSPDGRLVYLLLDTDGFRCLWAQRLDAAKKPVGPPFAVLHSHDAAHAFISTGYGRSIAGGKFVFSQTETTGNIWTTTVQIPR